MLMWLVARTDYSLGIPLLENFWKVESYYRKRDPCL